MCPYVSTVLLVLAVNTATSFKMPNDGTEKLLNADERIRRNRDDDDDDDEYTIEDKPAEYTHDYASVMSKSILFYEAQRSGKLPENNRIKWRDDSCLQDVVKENNGKRVYDLTGGWYDAGDNIKFNLPMAWSTSVLALGFIEFMDAYEKAGLMDDMIDSIAWPCDYLLKCHTKMGSEYYYQVGDSKVEHRVWDRPEDLTHDRPGFKVTLQDKGADVVGLASAALASCAVAFRKTGRDDISNVDEYARNAVSLYRFAKKVEGLHPGQKYVDKWADKLVYAAVWVHLVTGEPRYLTEAEELYDRFKLRGRSWAFGWSDSREATKLMLYKITGKDKYKKSVMNYLDNILPFNNPHLYTPRGLFFRAAWGSLRYSAGSVFIALIAAKYDLSPKVYREFACNQTNYMLGDNEHHSYVIGYGKDPPCRPHHRSSSCPDLGVKCKFRNAFSNPDCNPHELTGALVGGPNGDDEWKDDRHDYIKNEVACDYNAPFQGAIAGLLQLEMDDELPPACYILKEPV